MANTVTLTAPSWITAGSTISLPDGSQLTVAANGSVAVPVGSGTNIQELLAIGFSYGPTVAANVTAKAGGVIANATALTSRWNRVTVVATANDAVGLPASTAGSDVVVVNATANSANVYPVAGETILGGAANAAFALAANKSAIFRCSVAGTWDPQLGG